MLKRLLLFVSSAWLASCTAENEEKTYSLYKSDRDNQYYYRDKEQTFFGEYSGGEFFKYVRAAAVGYGEIEYLDWAEYCANAGPVFLSFGEAPPDTCGILTFQFEKVNSTRVQVRGFCKTSGEYCPVDVSRYPGPVVEYQLIDGKIDEYVMFPSHPDAWTFRLVAGVALGS